MTLQSAKLGLAFGMMLPVQGVGRAEATMYSYNGVVLPNIYKVYTPELQKTHPYALIIGGDLLGYRLICSSVPLYYNEIVLTAPYKQMWLAAKEDGEGISFSNDPYAAGPKDYWYESSTDVGEFSAGSKLLLVTEFDNGWANYDFRNYTDDAVVIAKSDPVPVYE